MTTSPRAAPPAHAAGTFAIGGQLRVHRLGFGAMRLTGPGVWGAPENPALARDVLREAIRLGVTFIDTAQAYGPEVSEQLIADTLHPYPDDLVIATKGGITRRGRRDPGQPDGRPERLRADCEGSLRRLKLDTIDLWQLHRIDPKIPLADQLGTVRELRDEGKIRFVGLSEVTTDQLAQARTLIDVATVQNHYNYHHRDAADVLAVCEADGLGFIPWWPLATGELTQASPTFAAASRRYHATASQLALAWLLRRSPVMLPIPGTGSPEHLRENVHAALIELSADDLD